MIRDWIKKKFFFYIEWYNDYKIDQQKFKLKHCGKNISIAEYVVIKYPEEIEIGDNTIINSFCHFWGGGGIKIGKNVLIASHCAITSMTHDKHGETYNLTSVKKPIIIGDNVWIGTHVIILPGVTIGNNTIIGAGAIVTKDLDNDSIYLGIPAKKIKE